MVQVYWLSIGTDRCASGLHSLQICSAHVIDLLWVDEVISLIDTPAVDLLRLPQLFRQPQRIDPGVGVFDIPLWPGAAEQPDRIGAGVLAD